MKGIRIFTWLKAKKKQKECLHNISAANKFGLVASYYVSGIRHYRCDMCRKEWS